MAKDLEVGTGVDGSGSDKRHLTPSWIVQLAQSKWGKLGFCFAGLQASYLVWGVVQEQLMTTEYSIGKFRSSTFCVFANRFLALIISMLIVGYQKYNSIESVGESKVVKDVPFYYYAPSSLSNTISSWAQYEALKFISFPTQVLSKSCKIIPVMIVGILLNRKSYPVQEYFEAAAITMGVALFTFSEKTPSHDERTDSAYGLTLLGLYLLCDSFTSQWQSRVFKQFNINQYQMMLGVNIWSMAMTGVSLISSGDFLPSLAFILADSKAFLHMMLLSITSATGQLFIFYTIKELGPVVFTIIMTTRQIFSLFISWWLFSHPMSPMGVVSALGVFGVVFNRIYRKGSD
jgi:solute carrier family 35 (adenosine 3'-phospho 5'-phosphosulfate transporter), member B2